jgi:hypothetical protein
LKHSDSPSPRRVRVAEGIYRENGSWITLYRWEGRQRSKVLKGTRNLSEARKARRQLLADLETKRAAPTSTITVSALAAEWLASREGRVKPRTFETDARGVALISRYFGGCRVQEVGRREVEAFLSALRRGAVGKSGRGLAEWTCARSLQVLRLILASAVPEILVANPCDPPAEARPPEAGEPPQPARPDRCRG